MTDISDDEAARYLPVRGNDDLKPVTDADMAEILPLVIALGQQFETIMRKHDYNRLCEKGDLHGIKNMLAEFRRIGESAFTPYISQKFPKHAVFFSHGQQAKDGQKQYVLSSEAFLLHFGANNTNVKSGTLIDLGINIAVIRDGKPVHGIFHYMTSNQTIATRNGHSYAYLHGISENEPLHVRSYYRENGVSPELMSLRGKNYFDDLDAESKSTPQSPTPIQIIEVASGCWDFTGTLESRLIETAAAHAILLNAGGSFQVQGAYDYREPYRSIKFVATDNKRVERAPETAVATSSPILVDMPQPA